MATRSTAALILLCDGLRVLGHDVAPVLRPLGLDPGHLDPEASVDRELERHANEVIAESLADPLAGLEVGASLGIGSYGPFTLLLLTCENAAQAAAASIRYQALAFLFGRLAFEPGRSRSALVLRPMPMPGRAHRFRVDLEVAGIWKLMRDLHAAAQVEVAPERIVMPYPRPAEADVYRERFGCAVQWDAREARLVVANEGLHRRFATADARAHQLIRAQCDRLVAGHEGRVRGLADRVRAHVAACMNELPTAAAAAAAVGTSERSLRRRLAEEDTSYRALLDEVRLRKAEEMLRDVRRGVEAIALRLGYSEPAAFIHAFRRWTGTTPAAYRRSILREGGGDDDACDENRAHDNGGAEAHVRAGARGRSAAVRRGRGR